MTKYMYLFRGGDEEMANKSPEQVEAHMEQWKNWMRTLGESGKLRGGEPLKAAGKVMEGKDKMITDGPFMEGKELVGGYVIVETETEEEAVEMAKGCPIFETGGTLEFREIAVIDL